MAMILLLPVTTVLVALVGFYVWHRQLVRKRHFEIADAALFAFCRAEVAIARAREPIVNAGEGTTRKRGDYELPAYGGMLDRLYIPVERLKAHRNVFEELDRAAVNAEVHFGSELAHHLREPLRAYHRIVVATACRMSNVGLSSETKVSGALVRQWEAVVHAGVTALDDTYELSLEMDEAKRAIETTLRPFVEAPTFSEFLLVHRPLRLALRRMRFAAPWARSGYGKIAVYAAATVSEPTVGDA
jgi:hypothetical protein